ncbi:TIGR03621 family F420-dependent LLM class oxidoreductase [Nonomuraea angiospora]|uniref:F420-dependent oxidoreductase n=1 Tax=Nonomuraea angiospora TaxID=46172 RepID=A0ABR9LQY6_9ACTN|nr:TIGR03621 family F420-dependent LLM class oxidoreductase [Nonomuraea angiospora]MBE1583073.1 putative F420-dependent oxidoreductase [Nonomuraea angiospora]
MRDFRFGCNVFSVGTRTEFVATCREADAYGFDVVLVPDHLGSGAGKPSATAPFPALALAAETSGRMRVGTFVLNIAYWNPYLLAREAATTDRLVGGRLEIGLGAGHLPAEAAEAGIAWARFADRLARLESSVERLRLLLEQDDRYAGAQRPRPPLLIAGTGDRILRLAARRADIVAVAGAYPCPGGRPRLGTAREIDERVRFVTGQAGERAGELELNLLVHEVIITRNRRSAAADLVAAHYPHYSVADALDSPFLLIGTRKQIAEQILQCRERYGFSYIAVHDCEMRSLGPVIGELGRAG